MLKEDIEKAKEFYTRLSEHEEKRAMQATEKSEIKNELLNASNFNRGRAKAMEEVLEFIEEYSG